jgi:hypothetical protein
MQASRTARIVSPTVTASALIVARRLLPAPFRRWLCWQRNKFRYWPLIGWVRFGDLRRVTPVSRDFGSDRGECIDRYYIENFLAQYDHNIRGSVLEIVNSTYTTRFGGDKVVKSDVLHVRGGNPRAKIVADLSSDNLMAPNSCLFGVQKPSAYFDLAFNYHL